MKYFVTIGETTHTIVVNGETVTLDGKSVRARLEELSGTPVQLLSIDNEVHRVLPRRGDRRGQYQLSVDGFRLQAEALDERARAIRELSGASAKPAEQTHLAAPMPGLIVRVHVSEGDPVRAGQGLIVMEAMKMENELRAAAAGVVRRVLVSPGGIVEKGELLLEMEPNNAT
jgi:pyruvate carboxylase subunit B